MSASNNHIKVSAIVSVYNCEAFIEGLLEDLINQSLYKKGQLEIILVDTASQQNEAPIIKSYQRRYDHIHYIRTEQRLTVYGAWNIGIEHSKGKYLTNANADDRHHMDALEIMARHLDQMPEVVLVYADVYVTETPNQTFDQADKSKRYYWYDWDRKTLLEKGCFIGPQPMWRRSVHDEYGLFDDSFVVSGDAEFWLRISQNHNFYHIREPLGLYLKSPHSVEHRNAGRRDFENLKIITMYREAHREGIIIRKRPTERIMDTTKGMISICVTARDSEHYDALEEMIKTFTECSYEIHRINSHEGKEGFSKALNHAIAKSKGEYIAILKDSILITDHCLEYLTEAIRGDIKILSPLTNQRMDLETLPYGSMAELRGFAKDLRERNLGRRIFVEKALAECVVFPQGLLSKIGPFDERFFSLHSCIQDLCLRAILEGYQTAIAGDVFVHCSEPSKLMPSERMLLTHKWSNIQASSPTGKRLLCLETVREVWRLFRQRYIDKAIKVIFDGISLIPDDPILHRELLKLLTYASRYEDVIKIAQTLGTLDRDMEFLRCNALISLGQIQTAESILKDLPLEHPQSQRLYGLIALNRSETDKAESLFQRAIELDPSFAEAHRNLGLVQYSKGQKTSGFKNLERAFILEPFNPRCAETYHLIASSEGLYNRAEAVFSEATRLYRDCKQPLMYLIDCLLQQEKNHDAMLKILRLLRDFDYDEQTLKVASQLRDRIGPLSNTSKEDSLSLCMIVKNEEKNLLHCLMSVLPVVDEIVVIDTGSTDKTKTLAYICGAKVYDCEWREDFAEARNFSLSKATGSWILILDADEVISKRDHALIRKLLRDRTKAYQVLTRNYTFDTSILGFVQNDDSYDEERGLGWIATVKIRLFPNRGDLRFVGKVHELVDYTVHRTDLKVEVAPFVVHHYGKLDQEKDRSKGELYYRVGKDKLMADPNDLKAIKELAIVSGGLGKTEEALNLWERVLDKEPQNLEALMNMMGLRLRQGDTDEAYSLAQRILTIDPENDLALRTLNSINARKA